MKLEDIEKIKKMEKKQMYLRISGWLLILISLLLFFKFKLSAFVLVIYLAGIALLIIQLYLRIKEYKYIKELNRNNPKNTEETKNKKKNKKVIKD